MLGAIYGDKAGSTYEYSQTKKVTPVLIDELEKEDAFYSDDTIETIAIMDAIINKKDYGETLKEYILKYESYRPNFKPYFKTAFSPGTIKWAKGIGRNDSIGNGSLMRISPVGYLFDSEEDVIENAKLATTPSHNSNEAIECATTVALMIYYFRKGLTKEEVFKKLNIYAEYKPFIRFNTTCYTTLNNCLWAIYNSNSFEDSIRKVLYMGGDTDTNACIVGSISESLYRMNEEETCFAKRDLPEEFVKVLNKVYK